jgi:hypothetical protein
MPYNLLMHYMRIWKYTIPTFKYRVGENEEVIKNGQSRDIERVYISQLIRYIRALLQQGYVATMLKSSL